jgi:RNA 3'-terminal phosphate cyclase (ATP)
VEAIELDGSQGEGGGQILRTALTLSMLTGKSFQIQRIRAGRSKPGLLRQHLTAVRAAAQICGARTEGAEAGSSALRFVPGKIRGGAYDFAIGTAGSCTLVLQTVLPALWLAEVPSTVCVSGGTHNSAAPPADFLMQAWMPLMQRMGVVMTLELIRHGFYPAGGGALRAQIEPIFTLQPLMLDVRGKLLAAQATAIVAGVSDDVARRELLALDRGLGDVLGKVGQDVRTLAAAEGPGNAVLLALRYEALTEVLTAFGERGVAAEAVAARLAKWARSFHAGGAAVGEYLADQLVLPMAIAGGGMFSTITMSSHLETNMAVIKRFLPVRFEVIQQADAYRVSVCTV